MDEQRIIIDIGGDNSEFKKSLDDAEKEAEKTSDKIGKMFQSLVTPQRARFDWSSLGATEMGDAVEEATSRMKSAREEAKRLDEETEEIFKNLNAAGLKVTKREVRTALDDVLKERQQAYKEQAKAAVEEEKRAARERSKVAAEAAKEAARAQKEEEKAFVEAQKRYTALQTAMDKAWNDPMKRIGESIANRLQKPFGKLGETIANIHRRFSKFTSAIARVAIYRAIRKVLKDITQGIREGIQNLYQYSTLLGTQFAKSIDTLASSALFIKNSFGAMVAPIVNLVTPAIENLARVIGDAGNRMAEFFTILTRGAGTQYSRAIWYTKKYQEAAKSAKKTLDLLGIDEINRLTDPKGSGSEEDYSKMFEEAIAGQGTGLASDLATAIEQDDWAKVGKVLADKLNEVLGVIDSSDIAKTIGAKFNNALTALASFIEALDWQKVSGAVVRKLQELQIDWETVGKLWASRITVVGDLFIGALEAIDWGQVGRAVGNFLKGQLDRLTYWIRNVDWEKLGGDIFDGLLEMVKNIDVIGVIQKFAQFFVSVIEGVGKFFIGLWKRFVAWLKGKVENPEDNSVFSGGGGNYGVGAGRKEQIKGKTYDFSTMADGGYVPRGDLFIANEAGPELVGTMNGRTYVGSNSDINSVGVGIENAVYAMANMVVQAIERKDTTVSLDGDKLSKAVSNRQNLAALARG